VRSTDPDLLKEYALKVWHYKQGEVVSLMVHLGDRLGLYQAMAGGEELTSGELAERTGLSERWVREWLLGQAAAGLIERAPDVGFSLSAEGEEVLAGDVVAYIGCTGFCTGPHLHFEVREVGSPVDPMLYLPR